MSKAEQFVVSLGWSYRESGIDQLALEVCPMCGADNYKFYICTEGEKDGVWDCKKCGESGNLYTLRKHLGMGNGEVVSMKEAATKPSPLHNPDVLHARLMQEENEDILDYLVADRGFSMGVIKQYKLGVELIDDKRWVSYPYFDKNGKHVFTKCRTVPPAAKEFRGSAGRENPLFNAGCLTQGMQRLFVVEGEADCLAALSNGITTVVGVPGANNKKSKWIDLIDEANPSVVYLIYDKDKAGQDGAKRIADKIGIDRCRNIVLPDFQIAEGKPGKDLGEWFKAGGTAEKLEELVLEAKQFDVDGVQDLPNVIEELKDQFLNKGVNPTYAAPWAKLNDRMGGYEPGDLITILAEEKRGKAQPLWARIKTPGQGWVLMRDIRPGAKVASVDGAESVVTGVFPQGKQDVYKITFSDGRTAFASGEHLWEVADQKNGRSKVITTLEIQKFIEKHKGKKLPNKYYVPRFNGEFGSMCYAPVDPWLLGVLLGDGDLTNATPAVHSTNKYIREEAARVVDSVDCYTTTLESGFRIRAKVGCSNKVMAGLKELGLDGRDCYSKFIPQRYMWSSKEDRLALLQGLMDTDGTVHEDGASTSYSTSSFQLAKDVQRLVHSLGGIAAISIKEPTFTYLGEKKKGQTSYTVRIAMPGEEIFRTAKMKLARAKKVKRQRYLTIESVEYHSTEEVQCIAVSHPSKLYITDDFIVTHNTTFAMNWLHHHVNTYKEAGLLFCMEMLPARLVRKWASFVTETDDTPGKSQMSVKTLDDALEVAKNMPADYLFGYSRSSEPKEVFNIIRQAVRRYGVKILCFDNLQFLSRSMDHQAQELGRLTKDFKQLAMELGIVILLIVQPHRIKDGQVATINNAMGSSAVAKDLDTSICLHRDIIGGNMKSGEFTGAVEIEEQFDSRMSVTVDRARFAAGGKTTLYFNGATSTVTEHSLEDQLALPKTGGIPVGEEAPIEA